VLLTTGEILTALNLLGRARRVRTLAELDALRPELEAFVDLPDLAVDVHVTSLEATGD
jgi:tRNA U54 and U55 pseudouridine synthase Pus10